METFKVYITFTGGGGTHVETHTDETLKGAILRLITGPAAVMGMIGEVKVVDIMDCTVFLFEKEHGIVFPVGFGKTPETTPVKFFNHPNV